VDPVVHLESPAHDVRVAAETVLPEPVAEHQHGLGAGLVLTGAEPAPEQRPHPEDLEIIGRDHAGLHPAGLAPAEENERHGVVLDQGLKRAAPLTVVGELRHREPRVVHPAEGRGLPEVDQALSVLVRQRTQQHAADHAEHGRVGADAERQGQHRDQGEAGALPQ
jgi:hypothetical protein